MDLDLQEYNKYKEQIHTYLRFEDLNKPIAHIFDIKLLKKRIHRENIPGAKPIYYIVYQYSGICFDKLENYGYVCGLYCKEQNGVNVIFESSHLFSEKATCEIKATFLGTVFYECDYEKSDI